MNEKQILVYAVINSLKIVMVYACFQEGMLLFRIREFVEFSLTGVVDFTGVCKPLWQCLTCMVSVWSIVFWFCSGNGVGWDLLWVMLVSGGINYILSVVIDFFTTSTIISNGQNSGR